MNRVKKRFFSLFFCFFFSLLCETAESKKMTTFSDHVAAFLDNFTAWYNKNTFRRDILNSDLDKKEQKRLLQAHDNRGLIVKDIIEKDTLKKVKDNYSVTLAEQKEFYSYELLKNVYLNFLQHSLNDTKALNDFIKTFEERVNINAIKRHLANVNNPTYSLALLKDIRHFLYDAYDLLQPSAENHKGVIQKLLALLEDIDLLSIENLKKTDAYKKINPPNQILLLPPDIKTNKKEISEFERLKNEFKVLKRQGVKAKKKLIDLEQQVHNLIGTLADKNHSYKKNYSTLFDAQMAMYKNELSKVSNGLILPHQAYKALGLLLWATPEEVKNAYTEDKGQAARNASNILNLAEGKQQYDVFLDDCMMLIRLGIDPYASVKSKALQNFLNAEGQLARLEIPKKIYDEVDPNNPQDNLIKKVHDFYMTVTTFINDL